MIVSVDEIKKYLRIDSEEEDTQIQALEAAAEEYLKNAGAVLSETNELAKLAVKILCVHWYENREPVGKADELAFSLQHIITQLKYCYQPPEEVAT